MTHETDQEIFLPKKRLFQFYNISFPLAFILVMVIVGGITIESAWIHTKKRLFQFYNISFPLAFILVVVIGGGIIIESAWIHMFLGRFLLAFGAVCLIYAFFAGFLNRSEIWLYQNRLVIWHSWPIPRWVWWMELDVPLKEIVKVFYHAEQTNKEYPVRYFLTFRTRGGGRSARLRMYPQKKVVDFIAKMDRLLAHYADNHAAIQRVGKRPAKLMVAILPLHPNREQWQLFARYHMYPTSQRTIGFGILIGLAYWLVTAISIEIRSGFIFIWEMYALGPTQGAMATLLGIVLLVLIYVSFVLIFNHQRIWWKDNQLIPKNGPFPFPQVFFRGEIVPIKDDLQDLVVEHGAAVTAVDENGTVITDVPDSILQESSRHQRARSTTAKVKFVYTNGKSKTLATLRDVQQARELAAGLEPLLRRSLADRIQLD